MPTKYPTKYPLVPYKYPIEVKVPYKYPIEVLKKKKKRKGEKKGRRSC
jgi:hypothetical protein